MGYFPNLLQSILDQHLFSGFDQIKNGFFFDHAGDKPIIKLILMLFQVPFKSKQQSFDIIAVDDAVVDYKSVYTITW